jgi:ribosomal protein L29
MKITVFKNELEKLNSAELTQKKDELRRELFSLRLNSMTAHVKDYSQIGKLRKNIARVLTYMRQIE